MIKSLKNKHQNIRLLAWNRDKKLKILKMDRECKDASSTHKHHEMEMTFWNAPHPGAAFILEKKWCWKLPRLITPLTQMLFKGLKKWLKVLCGKHIGETCMLIGVYKAHFRIRRGRWPTLVKKRPSTKHAGATDDINDSSLPLHVTVPVITVRQACNWHFTPIQQLPMLQAAPVFDSSNCQLVE